MGVAASAVLLAVGLIAFTGGRDDADGVVATDEAAQRAIAIAERFVEARDAWDGEAVRALVADDVEIIGEDQNRGVSTADQYLVSADFERVTGGRFLQPDCGATDTGPPIRVTCTYTMENAWSIALGVGPFTGSTFQFDIDNGLIQLVDHVFDFREFDPQVFTVWLDWLNDNHPDDVDVLYDLSGQAVVRTTPEALALVEQYTTEFQAVRTAVDFIDARDHWDGEAVRELVADDVEIIGEDQHRGVSTADQYLVSADFERVTGWRFLEPECTVTRFGPPVRVTCTYTMENAWSIALGVGPFTGSTFSFAITDGQIQRVNHDFDFREFDPQVFTVWLDWLNDNHPDDVDVLYDLSDQAVVHTTPEALALVEQYTTEFVESHDGAGSD